MVEQLPQILHKVDLLEGDGGAGSVLLLTFPPGSSGSFQQKEKFTVIEDEKRVKTVEVVEGGYLERGLNLYRVRLEFIEKQTQLGEEEKDSCITKSTVEYETNDLAAAGFAANGIQNFVANYLTNFC